MVPDDGVVVEALDPEPAHALDDVLDEVGGDHGGHVPVQLGEQQHLPLLKNFVGFRIEGETQFEIQCLCLRTNGSTTVFDSKELSVSCQFGFGIALHEV